MKLGCRYIVSTILILLLLLSSSAYAQYAVRGRVIDQSTREPLELAAVREAGGDKGIGGEMGLCGKKGVLADRLGDFALKTSSPDSATLLVTFIGYKPQHVRIKPGSAWPVIIPLEKGALDMKEVVVTNIVGGNTFHALSTIDLNRQPVKSAQDLLRLVPGLFIAQHQGGGKAEQIFLRGFDADHGTDVNVSVDGMPVNMVSHAHGQGYADLHFLIPETVANYDFGKGPYYTGKGDFTTAGYVAYHTKNVLDHNTVELEGGQFKTGRLLAMVNLLSDKAKDRGTSTYMAGDAVYSDGGPFDLPEHFHRFNLFGKFNTQLGEGSRLSISASSMESRWRSSGEIPNRAVAQGAAGGGAAVGGPAAEGHIGSRWGALDSSQGGNTSRTNVNLQLTSVLSRGLTLENQVWYSHYYFNLLSNFTFYYYYPVTGDEFRQHEQRDLMGYNGKISKKAVVGSLSLVSVAGYGFRSDYVNPSELDHSMNGVVLGPLQLGRTRESSVFGYFDEMIGAGRWLFNLGVRADYFNFYYRNMAPVSDTFASKTYTGVNPGAQRLVFSPKLNIQYTFNSRVQVYFKSGKGFHSNDARVAIANQGCDILPAAYGVDLGVNWKPVPELFINAALWYLYLQQEFTFGQDLIDQPGGPVQPSGKTKRTGVDLSARYQLTDWLFASLNVNLARPRYIDSAMGHDHVELAPTLTSTAGLDFRFKSGLNGGISYRYLHNRAANSTYTLTAVGYWVTDLAVNYTKKKYELGVSVENLLNITWNESQFAYVSRLKNEVQPVDEVSYTPGTPFFAKLKLVLFL